MLKKRIACSLLCLFGGMVLLSVSGCTQNAWDSPAQSATENLEKMALLDHINRENARNMKSAETLIAEAAITASASLQKLAATHAAVNPHVRIPPPLDPVRIGMADKASVDWAGPIEPLLKKIAQASHYKLHILGNAPSIPILVSVSASDMPLASILRDLTFQAHKQAHVVLYPSHHVIELHYLGG